MSNSYYLWVLVFFVLTVSCKDDKSANKVKRTQEQYIDSAVKPNIIYILADDLGYGELGAYGQDKIETPYIDALAKNGMMFSQHYTSAPVCAPARFMLMTGKHAGHAYIRGNDEWRERGDVRNYKAMYKDSTLEGQRPIPSNTVLLPQKLNDAGYATGVVGKWGLGAPHTNSIPTKMGFDFFFGYNCQRQAHTYYPMHLYKNENRVHLNNKMIAPHTKLAKGADANDLESYKDFTLNDYAPDLIFDEMMGFVSENKDNPFYLYWATPIPHNAIQAPQRWLDHYIEKFGKEEPYLGEKNYFPHKNPRAGYAAMISYLDENVGKLIKYLKDEGIYDNTLIIFTSDNGVTYTGGTDGEFFNSSGAFGEEYGKGKGYVYEGGIRVPMIASWPKHIKAGSTSDLISAHYDVMATVSELVGFDAPEDTDGISFLPTLLGKEGQNQHDFLYWEFPEQGGQLAIRMGDWKVVCQNLNGNRKRPSLELYNLIDDPAESVNLAKDHPEIIKKATDILIKEHQIPEIERFRIPLLDAGKLPESI